MGESKLHDLRAKENTKINFRHGSCDNMKWIQSTHVSFGSPAEDFIKHSDDSSETPRGWEMVCFCHKNKSKKYEYEDQRCIHYFSNKIWMERTTWNI
jgi:hypothetical protein